LKKICAQLLELCYREGQFLKGYFGEKLEMANYWAVSIGINQYRFFPALSYAQRDADLLHETLLQSGYAAQRCGLLSDRITITSTDPGFPSAQSIQAQLEQVCQRVKPGDVLLCFFSGYGLHLEGEDYLLPIEADPRQLTTTGIAVTDLIKTLKTAATKNIVLLIDANRSQFNLESLRSQPGFGTQTLQLGQSQDLAILLSCRSDQFSHEPLTLRQGIFTTALVAALQTCMTLEQLVEAMGQRLPELSEEVWRPRQDLQAVVPPQLRYQLIVPELRPSKPAKALVAKDHQPSFLSGLLPRGLQRLQRAIPATQPAWTAPVASYSGPLSGGTARTGIASGMSQLHQIKTDMSRKLTSLKLTGLWPKLAPTETPVQAPVQTALPTGTKMAIAPTGLADQASALNDDFFWRRLLAQGGLVAGILLFGVILRNSGALINAPEAARRLESQFSSRIQIPPTEPIVSSPEMQTLAVEPRLIMQSAQAAFAAQQYEEANRQLIQIPAAQRNPAQTQLLEQTNRELLNQAKTMLIRTRDPMPENQVSDLVEAIKVARLIRVDQPLYQESQQNIDRWSRLIMDMAQGRAERANGSEPIEAANNYSKAISAAKLVPTDQKVYIQAQQAIQMWSKMILDLANSRASNADLDLAIQIGELVPMNTPEYSAAQEAIANWRNQPLTPVAPAEEASL
jgi:uncharacterized caspase-like protein